MRRCRPILNLIKLNYYALTSLVVENRLATCTYRTLSALNVVIVLVNVPSTLSVPVQPAPSFGALPKPPPV